MKIVCILMLTQVLASCSSMMGKEYDSWADAQSQYPDCSHQRYDVVMKCKEINDKGEKISALRVEQLMKEGKL